MLVEALRLIIVLAMMAGAYGFATGRPGVLSGLGVGPETEILLITVLGAGIGYVLGGFFARWTDQILHTAETTLARRHVSEVLASVLGLLVGLVLGAMVAWPILIVIGPPQVSYPVAAFLLVILGAFGARFAVRKRLELFGVLGVTPQSQGSSQEGGGCLLDASAAIDGRVIALWRAGLVPSPLWVPGFIIWELQGIADSSDPGRRRRGQRGLDVLTSLREAGAEVRVLDEDPAGTTEPDAKLVVVARRRGLPIVTSDSNLAKAAELQGLGVLNLHGLAELLRPPVLPGETTTVQLIKEGREQRQAVGYFDDGTMVVVERADQRLGDEVEIQVTSVIQTGTGRMVFGHLASEEPIEAKLEEADGGGEEPGLREAK